jgi:hypothetical protein
MRNIHTLYCLITADRSSQKIFVASSEDDSLVFPNTIIENPKFLYNEIKYNIQQMFAKNSIQFLEEIIISFLDIQNYLLLNLIESSEKYKHIDIDHDVILLCGVVLHEPILSNKLLWKPIENQLMSNEPEKINHSYNIIKYVFDQMIL